MTSQSPPDIIVVGAGAFGVWTALSAAERGATVRLIDMSEVGNSRASSGGASRNIRAAYGADEFYTQLAMQAWAVWNRRSADFGRQLLYPSGALRSGDVSTLRTQGETFARCRQPYELIEGAEASHRWPELNYANEELLFYEPLAGVILASEALQQAATRLCALGGVVERGRVQVREEEGKPICMLAGSRLVAGRIVLAVGPWLPAMFPALIGPLMRTPRRELFFFASPSRGPSFMFDRLPCLADHDAWTSSDIGNGLKVAPRMRHTPLDPDNDPGPPSPAMAEAARRYLAVRIPALANGPIVSTYVGQLENTANEDFIIDTHPNNNQIVIAGGGSGHAFKFGPLLGVHIADFALFDDLPIMWRNRFALSNHRPVRDGEAG